MGLVGVCLAACVAVAVASASAQTRSGSESVRNSEVDIKDGVRVPSPEGSWVLVGKGFNIVLENRHTGESRPVMTISQAVDQVAWSPDGASFFVNDREASNVEKAYVFQAATLVRLDLGGQIASDISQFHPQWARYLIPQTNHIYFHAERWMDARKVAVSLSGHFDGFCSRWGKDDCCKKNPEREFTMHYVVDVKGETHLLSGGPGRCKECAGR